MRELEKDRMTGVEKRKEKKRKEKKEGREMHNFVSNISPVSLTASNVIPALQQKAF
jgi:hypothetical protein